MLFTQLLNRGDFSDCVQSLARDARERLGIPFPVNQVGVVVPDVVKAAADLEEAGIPPFLLLGGAARDWTERGTPGAMRSRLGFGYHRGIEIELLEPGVGSDFYRRSLDPQGRPIIQHLGFLVRDVDEWAKKLNGTPVYVRGKIGLGPLRIDFAYMDTERDAGIILEFISHRFLGVRIRPPEGFQQLIGRIEKKSGKRCIEV